jgi:hypothetical protein
MSPVSRVSKPQQEQTESTLARAVRTAAAWVTSRRETRNESPRRFVDVRPDMPVTREEECLTTHF